jgi:hypothetical protein
LPPDTVDADAGGTRVSPPVMHARNPVCHHE